jgi:hypothetical protein
MKIQATPGRSSRPYTYEIDADVQEGDTIMVPPPFWDPRGPAVEATVVALESDYDGPLTLAWLPVKEIRQP